jgi:Domain of unknown function (DUF4421)
MIRYLFVLFLLLFVTEATVGQNPSDSTKSKYIEQFHDKFFIWPVIKKRTLSFDIRSLEEGSQKINYKPNSSFSVGLGIYLFEIGAEITFAVPINEKNRTTYGSTDAREFRANFLGNGWGLDVFRQNYKGFYFPVRTGSSPDTFVKRPDIELINTGINGIYVFDKKRFSLKSAYNYSERQIKSGGSFILTGNLTTFRLNADSVILSKQSSQPAPGSDFQLMRYTTLSIAGGYTYTLVYRSFFLNGALSIGPAHNWILYNRPGESEHYDIAINTFNDIRVALGYNSDRFFGGMSLVAQSRNIRFENIQFANTNTIVKLLFGYRFNEVGILKKRAKDYIPVNIP